MPSFTDFDRSYRRGIILGLSLAELFIILTFLLLLAMVSHSDSRSSKETETNIPSNGTDSPSEKDSGSPTDGLTTVAESSSGKEIENDGPNELIAVMERKIDRLTAQNKELEDFLAKENSSADIGKQVQHEAEELGVSPNKLISAATEHITNSSPANNSMGQDSPCWYEMSKRSNGEDYEKALYIFDIRINDSSIFVKDIPAPTGRHQTQKEALDFDRTALNRELNYDEFIPAFKSLRKAGENKEVRNDRRCTFYVHTWDATSDFNKSGYKKAHNNIVENVFITYEEPRKPWPH